MKKLIALILALSLIAACTFLFTACDKTVTAYTVTFDTNGGSAIDSQQIDSGGKATRPDPKPTKNFFTFVNWYESGQTTPFDFDQEIKADTTIYAKWAPLDGKYFTSDQRIDFIAEAFEELTNSTDWKINQTNTINGQLNYTLDIISSGTEDDFIAKVGDTYFAKTTLGEWYEIAFDRAGEDVSFNYYDSFTKIKSRFFSAVSSCSVFGLSGKIYSVNITCTSTVVNEKGIYTLTATETISGSNGAGSHSYVIVIDDGKITSITETNLTLSTGTIYILTSVFTREVTPSDVDIPADWENHLS